jgi:hypothetical protein
MNSTYGPATVNSLPVLKAHKDRLDPDLIIDGPVRGDIKMRGQRQSG